MNPHRNLKALTVLAARWFIARLTALGTVPATSVTLVVVRTLATLVTAVRSVVAANADCTRSQSNMLHLLWRW